MLRLVVLAACCLLVGGCGSSPAPRAAQTGPNGLTVGDQEAMRQVGIAANLRRETAGTTRTLIADQTVAGDALAVRLDAELFRGRTVVERMTREARELRDPALVRGMRKVLRLLREEQQQYALAARARLAGDPQASSAASLRALELDTQAEQTLRRLLGRFASLPG